MYNTKRSGGVPHNTTQSVALVILLILFGIGIGVTVRAETYTIDGKAGATKVQAMQAAYTNPKAVIERCKFKEKKNSNEGSVLCRPVEIGPSGTLVLQK